MASNNSFSGPGYLH